MNNIIKILLILSIVSFCTQMQAQSPEAVAQVKARIYKYLQDGDCDKAQESYQNLKIAVGEITDIEENIAECQKNAHPSYLTLSSYSESFKAEGESKTITVNASAEWHIGTQPDASWVSYAINGDRLTIKVSPNPRTTKRTDYFTVKCGDNEKRFDITQAAATPTTPPATSSNAQTFTVKGVTFKMIRVQGGTFTMGCTSEQGSDCDYDESPAHNVTLSDYYIGQTEVTQALWRAVMGGNPSHYEGDNRPVEKVDWYDAVEFCNKLSSALGLRPYYSINKSVQDPNNSNSNDEKKYIVTINSGANGFRLPTEAEWEYAARGGNKTNRYKYAGSDNIDYVAWYIKTTNDSGTKPVKRKSPNELGLYDMSGNVWEWCWDWYGNYSGNSQTNPTGPYAGSARVSRGGSWNFHASSCRVSDRIHDTPVLRYYNLGFRLAL